MDPVGPRQGFPRIDCQRIEGGDPGRENRGQHEHDHDDGTNRAERVASREKARSAPPALGASAGLGQFPFDVDTVQAMVSGDF